MKLDGVIRIGVSARVAWARLILGFVKAHRTIDVKEAESLQRLIEDLDDARQAEVKRSQELHHGATELSNSIENNDMVRMLYWVSRLNVLGMQSEQIEGSEQ
jgi:hypothetical protein